METPSVATAIWLMAAFDPILIAVAGYLGWKADQAGKLVVAVIAALMAAVLAAWAITAVGLPWIAPVGGEHPSLLPVRTIAALVWSSAAFGIRRMTQRA
ncbi:hypothetical protein [Salinarimonas ramus]|uniref:Uncharacterized protein n=1 Tax=Salinarimonas ramus TaxID=690164 RepID=A0A917Q6D8_9HYPH|nr:hypothetical protein [Salinarimonas ramus]GGK22414.1 hypothetical protein GCM10011322_06360 [Salinarimonas ramus]